jgi:predicted CXXCH cytochrome family protein
MARFFTTPRWAAALAVAIVAVVAAAAALWVFTSRAPEHAAKTSKPQPGPDAAHFVGSEQCQSCHREAYEVWHGSQHQRAMQHADTTSVRGDFADAKFTYAGIETRFFTRDGRYWVRTDNAAGELEDFEIRYTFGVDPLQQYLIEFPDGRMQALSIAWDTRPADAGGQRWFHLYPDEEIVHGDALHWTGRQQNWNFMCADCHSTDLRKNYDPAADTFATRWAEISVGCEACHGPGSQHIDWARQSGATDADAGAHLGLTVQLDARTGAGWRIDPASGQPTRAVAKPHDHEVEVCAQCHSRRSQIAEGYRAGDPFLDHYLPAMIDPPFYWVDGQQREEVYVWGSFLQSRMYAAGVTCSDCHDAHTGKMRAEGNAVCTQCHAANRFDGSQHHFHPAGATSSACVSCHMPASTYMLIDPRRDHSLRVPRPDESIAFGVPNACNACHEAETAEWAAERLRAWYGEAPRGYQQFAGALYSAEQARARAPANLAAVLQDRGQPNIIRATAAGMLADHPDPVLESSLPRALSDEDALVRREALTALHLFAPPARARLAAPLLDDPVRIVRIEAASALAGEPEAALSADARAAFDQAAQEFLAVQAYNADRPEAAMLSAGFRARRGQTDVAERGYRSVLATDPGYVPAYLNLADLYRAAARESDAEATLRAGLVAAPDNAMLHHALGLALVRGGQMELALSKLARAAELAPEETRYAYVHAIALNDAGDAPAALEALDTALEHAPESRELLLAAATISRDLGRPAEALRHARRLAQLYPDDAGAQSILAEMKRAVTE